MTLTVLDQLLAIGDLFERDMAAAFSGTSLTKVRLHALWVLHHSGPITQRELGAALGTTPRSVSALVDALESTGYITRAPHPSDRRAVLLTLSPSTVGMMQQMEADHARLTTDLLESVDPADRDAFARGVDAVLGKLTQLVEASARS